MKLLSPLIPAAVLAVPFDGSEYYESPTTKGPRTGGKNIQAHAHTHGTELHAGVPWNVDVKGAATTVFSGTNSEYMSTGEEIIIPINVHDPTDTVAWTFFNTTNYYINKDFNSWHNGSYGSEFPTIQGDYVFEAHYRGRETAYYNPQVSSNFKAQAKAGWNAIASDTGLQITWEGDLEACTNIKPTADHSNQECTFDKANEYCHRHAGELFIPGEYYWHFFFNPMCSEIGSAAVKSGANILGATYSNSDYWVNLRREVVGSELNVETTSKFHFFDQLDKNHNVYTGWDSNQESIETGDFSNVHQQVIKTPANLDNRTHEFFSLTDFRKLENHEKLCGDCNYNYDTSDQKAYAQAYRNTINNGVSHLNMKYISQHITTGGYASKPCAKMYCGPDQTEPKVQDTMCDHNDIRPMCIIRNPLGYKAYCPKELKIDQCGEKVAPVIVASVYGSQATPQHEFGNPSGGDVEYNFINHFKAVADQMKQKLVDQGDINNAFMNYQSPTMYLNCLGECTDQTDGSVICDAQTLSANQRQLCGTHGFVYTDDTVSTAIFAEYQFAAGLCQCECSAAPVWSPDNSIATSGSGLTTVDGYRKYCCDVGYTLVAENNQVYTMEDGCIKVECDDLSTTAESQYKPFWETGMTADKVNKGAGWFSGNGFHNSIQARCIPASCPAPPNNVVTGDGVVTVVGPVRSEYTNAETIGYDCPADYCGSLSSECIAGVNDGILGGSWTTPTGVCTPKFCTAPIATAHMTIDTVGNMANGDQYEVKCNNGFGLYRISTGVRIDLNSGFGQCEAFSQNECSYPLGLDFECKPLTCVDTNPCGNGLVNGGLNADNIYAIGDKVTCDCLLNLQAQQVCEAQCTFIDGDETAGIADTTGFVVTNCQCTDPECPPAADIPHGFAVSAGHEGAAQVTVYDGNSISQGQFISYQCDAGYDLAFTDDDSPATWQQCIRECHTPISCSNPEGHGFPETDKDRFPILDPLACYCKPKLCPKHEISALPLYDYAKPGAAEDPHVEKSFYNTIDVVCKDRYFNRNGNRAETVRCENDVWTTVDTCVELTCADPREANNMSPTVNLEHTCAHLDTIDFDGNGTNQVIKDLTGTTNEVIYGNTNPATEERLVYGDPKNSYAQYFIKTAGVNIKDGSVQTFTCKPGFKPYLNFPAALAADNFGPGKGSSFDCTCMAGKWICSHSCRCDSYCPTI